tara:strand:+ start:194 stop:1081 length:888 start_codon:yes stop_codon:yes gene_type:complete
MKKIKKVIIYSHQKYFANSNIKKIMNHLIKRGVKLTLISQHSGYAKIESTDEIINNNIPFSKSKINSDLIIVFGGDGLFLTASKIAINLNVPILGINYGKIGFLVDIDKKQALKQITAIISGDYIIDNRMMLDTKIQDKQNNISKSISLNDVVIHNYGQLKMIKMKIFVNNFLINVQRSDGIIIATPTGSTAYSMSNGCPIVSPDSNVICCTPVSPHTYSHRPIIVNEKDKIKIEVDKLSVNHTMTTVDGSNNNNFEKSKVIEIMKSRSKLKILHPVEYNYFQILNKKLKWGGRS